jgi:membrane-associated PAP2 superfamily phosphatase
MKKVIPILINNSKWLLPILFMLFIAPFTPYVDLQLSRFFYNQDQFYNPPLFQFLYNYGEIFGFFIAGASTLIFLFSYYFSFLKKYRTHCLAFLITFVIGAGLLTNTLFKGYWGRPRPKQLIEFGGTYEYRPFYKPNFFPHESQKSFPSGHVAMGFCYLSFCISLRRQQKSPVYYMALALTLFSGCGLMVARVAQGGHFFSDTLFSFILIWLIAHLANSFLSRQTIGFFLKL